VNASPEGGGEVEITTSEMDADIPCSYPATITVDYGDDITIEAIPSAGYHFTGWEGEPTIDERRNPIKTTFDNPIEITATFALDFIEFAWLITHHSPTRAALSSLPTTWNPAEPPLSHRLL